MLQVSGVALASLPHATDLALCPSWYPWALSKWTVCEESASNVDAVPPAKTMMAYSLSLYLGTLALVLYAVAAAWCVFAVPPLSLWY